MARKYNPFDPADASLHDPQHIPSGEAASRNDLIPGLRVRHDGWTQERTQRFFDALAHTGCLKDACRIAGLSKNAAYRNRARFPEFAKAWDEALERAQQGLIAIAYKRAVEGAEEVIIRKGEVHEIRKKPSDAMLGLLLRRQEGADGGGVTISWAEWQANWRFDCWGEKFQQEMSDEEEEAEAEKEFDRRMERLRVT